MEIYMTTETEIAVKSVDATVAKVIVPTEHITLGVVLLIAGALLIFAVGFAEGAGGFLHNAAHDTRHAVTIPCH